MVPINRNVFRTELSNDPVVQGFAELVLSGRTPPSETAGLSQRGRITIKALRALAMGQNEEFSLAYEEICRRQISDDADWIYDDYLLFALILGKRRFAANGQFLSKVLEQRRKVQGPQGRDLLDDFEKLMANQRLEVDTPVLIVGSFLTGELGHHTDGLVSAYRLATRVLTDSRTSEFMKILSMRTVDLVVECSPISDAIPAVFWRTFERRASCVAQVVHASLSVIAVLAWCYLGAHYLFGSGAIATWAEKLFSMSLVVAPTAVLMARSKVVSTLKLCIVRFWGGGEIAAKLPNYNPPR